jgi:hypothetical protein
MVASSCTKQMFNLANCIHFFQSCTCVLYVDAFDPMSWSDSDSCELGDVSVSSSIKLSATLA